eukprot:COSAG01_NODE_6697_length_3539_cov_4.359302_2_plen_1026_part_00
MESLLGGGGPGGGSLLSASSRSDARDDTPSTAAAEGPGPRRFSVQGTSPGDVLPQVGLDVIEGRAVSVRFLRCFTREHITPALKHKATRDAIEHLDGRIRAVKQELALGSASTAGTQTKDLGDELFRRYLQGQMGADEYNARRGAHEIAAQQRSNEEILRDSLEALQADLAKRKAAPYVTARDIHKLVVKAACDEPMCRYCELPDPRAAPTWSFGGPAPCVGGGKDPQSGTPDFGAADFFLSYNWDTPWDELLDALATHSEEQEAVGSQPPPPHYYWIDIFAVNQHWKTSACEPGCAGCAAVAEDMHDWATADPENPKGFERVISFTRRTVMLMEPWDRPRPPTRVWCLFEGNTTLAKGGQLEAVLGRRQRRELQRALEKRFHELESSLSRIDARRAEATVIEDRAAIFNAVEDMDQGFEGLNDAMRSALRRWLAEAAADLVERLRPGRPPLSAAELRSEAEEHGRCTGSCIGCLDRWPLIPQLMASIAIAMLAVILILCVFFASYGSTGWSLGPSLRRWPTLWQVFWVMLCICPGLTAMSAVCELYQKRHQLRRIPLCGLGAVTRNLRHIWAATMWFITIVFLVFSLVFTIYESIYESITISFYGWFSAAILAYGLLFASYRARTAVEQRAAFAIRAGWVQLNLHKPEAAADIFRRTHEELQLALGPECPEGWLAMAPLAFALCRQNGCEPMSGTTMPPEVQALARQFELAYGRFFRSYDGLLPSKRRILRCDFFHRKEARYMWCYLKATSLVAMHQLDTAVLKYLEAWMEDDPLPVDEFTCKKESGYGRGFILEPGSNVRPGTTGECWTPFVLRMATGGQASSEERRRWDTVLTKYDDYKAAHSNQQRRGFQCLGCSILILLAIILAGVMAANRAKCFSGAPWYWWCLGDAANAFPPAYTISGSNTVRSVDGVYRLTQFRSTWPQVPRNMEGVIPVFQKNGFGENGYALCYREFGAGITWVVAEDERCIFNPSFGSIQSSADSSTRCGINPADERCAGKWRAYENSDYVVNPDLEVVSAWAKP